MAEVIEWKENTVRRRYAMLTAVESPITIAGLVGLAWVHEVVQNAWSGPNPPGLPFSVNEFLSIELSVAATLAVGFTLMFWSAMVHGRSPLKVGISANRLYIEYAGTRPSLFLRMWPFRAPAYIPWRELAPPRPHRPGAMRVRGMAFYKVRFPPGSPTPRFWGIMGLGFENIEWLRPVLEARTRAPEAEGTNFQVGPSRL